MRPNRILIGLLAAALAGCGGGGGSNGGDTPPPPPPQKIDRLTVTASPLATLVASAGTTEIDFTISNPSGLPARNVRLNVQLGFGLTRTKMECTAVLPATCPSDPVVSTIDSLPGGGTVRFRWTIAVERGTSGLRATNVTVESADDEVPGNNSTAVSFTTYAAEVSVVASTSAGAVTTGSDVPYSITVANAGPDAARDLQMRDTLSEGQALKSIGCTASGGATCPTTLGAAMTVPLLPSGGSLTFAIVGKLADDVIVPARNTLQVTVAGDGNPYNDKASAVASTRLPTSPGMPTFVVLQSEDDEIVGRGQDWSYNQTNAVFDVYEADGHLNVLVHGDRFSHAEFYMPSNLAHVTPGTYVDAIGAPNHNPATGGMSWTLGAQGCGAHSDKFTVDNVTYAQGVIASVDIRFEQTCQGYNKTLRGQIHWVANDATHSAGPVNPPPPGLWAPAAGVTPASGNFVYFESEPHDYIGEGRTEVFTQANSVLTVQDTVDGLKIKMVGNRSYDVLFKEMAPLTQLEPGYYPGAQIAYGGNPTVGRMLFSGDGRGCISIKGWFVIDNIAFAAAGDVIALDARFLQHCDGYPPALRGAIHWRSADPTQPVGPQVPPPSGLWSPPANVIPASGNFVYVESDAGDFVGQGLSRVYTPLDSVIEMGTGSITTAGNHFEIRVDGDEQWVGNFQAMNTLPDLVPGYYGDLLGFPFHNPTAGGLSWGGESRGCNVADGWFVIDSITYSGNALRSVTLRFQQHCEHLAASLRGMIRWSADDHRQPLPPATIPPNLWQPPAGATPASGNYMYVQGKEGSYILGDYTFVYTPLNAQFTLTTAGSELSVNVHGDTSVNATFKPMVSLEQLQPGFYDLPFGGSLAKGDFTFSGYSRGCSPTIGWFVVDSVAYNAGSLSAIDLRFKQQCVYLGQVLEPVYGKIHWRADDTTRPPGPQNPPPAGLWEAPANAVPASGNFFYLQSDSQDGIGLGNTYNYTPANATFQFETWNSGEAVQFKAMNPASTHFTLVLNRMNSISRLQRGYYPNVQRGLSGNPTVGGLDLSSNVVGCSSVTGWFVIHDIAFSGDTVTSIDATFEQHCQGAPAAARGRFRWSP